MLRASSRTASCHHLLARPGCACCSAEIRHVTARVNLDLSRRGFIAGATASVASLGLPAYAQAPAAALAGPPTLFTNLALFDGLNLNVRQGARVLVRGDRIEAVLIDGAAAPDDAVEVDCGGGTLMPGLIDAHWHTMMVAMALPRLLTAEVGDLHLTAAVAAERTLMRGFTTVRDMGGPSFALKRAVDEGLVAGPRIYPSGAIVSQTAGHGDFRNVWEVPREAYGLSRGEILGAAALADGRDGVLRATREQLMLGASQIKIVAGGGIASSYDPIDVTEFLPEEIEASVLAAADWGTYVAAHVYTPVGIQRCLRAGVRTIEHGQLADEDSVLMMADTGAVWSLQPFLRELHAAPDRLPPERLEKWEAVWAGTDEGYRLAAKHGVPTGFGTDFLFDPPAAELQGRWLAALTRWMTPAQALKAATADNAFILGMSGPRNPYPAKLGVIEAGAYADLLVVAGDPTSDLSLVADPDANFRVIMKGGRVHKNTL